MENCAAISQLEVLILTADLVFWTCNFKIDTIEIHEKINRHVTAMARDQARKSEVTTWLACKSVLCYTLFTSEHQVNQGQEH